MENEVDPPEARARRAELVASLASYGDVRTRGVRDALLSVPRHLFVPPSTSLADAYANVPLPIGFDQTISQPTVVAEMTELLLLTRNERVLEIGTGSAYQAAVLSLLAREVFSIELFDEIANNARERLARLGYTNVHVRAGDGWKGWPEEAPFDRIVVTAAPESIPKALVAQLADEGVLVCPVGPQGETQRLVRVRRRHDVLTTEQIAAVRFVPMAHARA